MITAEQARKNLPSKEEILENYLTEVIEDKIREVSTRNNKTEFSMYKDKEEGKWRLQSLPRIKVWGDEPFDGEKFTNLVISVLKENEYTVKIEIDPETEHYATVYASLIVSWGTKQDCEKRWYIHQYDASNGYVNLHKEQKEYVLSTKGDTDSYKTEFTRSEIGDWAKTDSNEVIDWIINKFGEEVK